MRILLSVLIYFIAFLTVQAQTTNPYAKAIKEQADLMGQAILQSNYNAFIKYTHPKVVEKLGGKEQMLADMESSINQMKAEGAEISSVKFGDPTGLISTNSDLQCILPQKLEINVTGGRLVANSTLVAVSKDKGKTWHFIDYAGMDIKALQQVVPEISEKLVLPVQQQPVFIED
ncbi:MAG: hypothetical protein LPK19_16030 [Hymenobacteraceae bacterium]|nr:hypothetical protein [Hymenobacteraceae bacterium]MDX5397751.1 hypothetical protein [Hymenobacteraceae bacterium]MDX5513828.1 hypothetical protein [Hymenobacteraceae bacterium]